MKTKYKIIISTFLLVGFSSCLKDKNVDDQIYGLNGQGDKNQTVELPYQASKLNTIALNTLPATEDVGVVEVNLPNNQVASEDIQVSLVKNMTLVADWNTTNGTNYIDMPSNSYSIINPGGLTIKIPKGSSKGFLVYQINKTNISFTQSYGIGYSIASVSPAKYNIAANFKDVIVNVVVKNKYDGVYDLRSQMLDWTPVYGIANYVWDWPGDVYLITSGPSSVKLFDAWGFNAYIHPIRLSTNAASGFGQTELKLTFDPATDLLQSAINDITATNGRAFQKNNAFPNSKWTATKTYAATILTQPGRPNLQIFDTLTYTGPR
jgi:hypothetical protein